MTIAETYAQNFWQLGNILTGFAITEVLVVALAIGSSAHLENRLIENRAWALIASLLAHISFGCGVWWCHAVGMSLLPPDPQRAAICATIRCLRLAELLGIAIFGLMMLIIIWQAKEQQEFAKPY
jgi:hypothetical protein